MNEKIEKLIQKDKYKNEQDLYEGLLDQIYSYDEISVASAIGCLELAKAEIINKARINQ